MESLTLGTLFSLNFASTKFLDFCNFENIAKFNAGILKSPNLILYQLLFCNCFSNMSQLHVSEFFCLIFTWGVCGVLPSSGLLGSLLFSLRLPGGCGVLPSSGLVGIFNRVSCMGSN